MKDKHRNYNRQRKNKFTLQLSEDEFFILDQKTKLSGIRSKSAFLRHLILYGYVYDVDYSFLREYNENLAKIGNNLNQATKRLNATGHVYEDDVKEIKNLMEKVWDTQEKMLRKQPVRKQ